MCQSSELPAKGDGRGAGLFRRSLRLVGALAEFSNASTAVASRPKPPSERPKRSHSDGSISERRVPHLTLDEVARHNTEADCWLIIKNKVYDVTGFGATHPGGRVIYTYGGKDATDVFSTFHAPATFQQLKPLLVGTLESSPVVPQLLADFRDLRASLQQQGLFNSSKLYYVYKVLSNFSILAGALTLLMFYRDSSWLAMVGSAFLLGLFWQQSGWLAHDFLHHQVFKNRAANNYMGYLLGNICQGFSCDWWKSKHNTHHAAPNELSEDKHAVDPDIDTLPLLAWSTDMLDTVSDGTHRMLVRMQHYFFFPILLFARISWCQQSFSHSLDLSKVSPRGWEELVFLGLHYAWYLGLVFGNLPFFKACLFLLLSQMFSGFLLSIVFVQSHNGMEVYCDPKDFVTAQVVSTRDIASNIWNDWFTGGLNYQIEHHLFPTLPRHNLGKIRKQVQSLCERHGLVYESCSMATGTARVLRCLADIAAQA